LANVLKSNHAVAADAPVSFLELRMVDGIAVGLISSLGKLLRFDAVDGAVLAGPDTAGKVSLPPIGGQPSLRNTIKNIHRMTAYGDFATLIFALIALALCVMLVSGLVMYYRLLNARSRAGRSNLYWSAGGWFRSIHRGIAVSASLFLVVVVFSGTFLALGSIGVSYNRMTHPGRPGLTADVSRPLADVELPGMLHTALTAFHAADPRAPIKVLRLRYFAGMPQGIVVGGEGENTRQLAFNTATGGRASLSGPNYPVTGQPFGWEADQVGKGIHRGDMFGMTGRWLSLFTGLSLLFLAISGAVMYLDLWIERRRAGRRGLFWS
jgi:uncharacterized iron-regulated membrane protein